MANIEQYLEALALSNGYELCIEPNKPPVVLSDSGSLNLGEVALQGAEITKIIFPLIPFEAKQKLPDSPHVEFVYETDSGQFNFLVKKSPAGFNVIITRPLSKQASQSVKTANNSMPANYSAPLNNVIADTPYEIPEYNNNFTENTAQNLNRINQSKNYPQSFPESEIFPQTNAYIEKAQSSETENFENPSASNKFLNAEIAKTAQTVAASPASNYAASQTTMPQQTDAPQNYSQQFQPVPSQQSFYPPQSYPQNDMFAPSQDFQMPVTETDSCVFPTETKSEIDLLFRKMADLGASDLHLSVSMPPMVRKDGKMQVLEQGKDKISSERMKELLFSIMPAKNREEFNRRHDTDFAYEIEGLARFRANVFMDRKGAGGVFRIIPSKILTAEQLGLSQAIMNLCDLSKGLVVVTGPTGSGKSTTLCAMIDSINKKREDHIITIEDPIEFVHENQKCLVNQREVHNHTDSFKDALRAALREDPDILLVGEMRDLETISIAIETAETGHLVFGTLHTTTAASTVDRIIDQFPADRQQQIRVMLSESLKGVIAQTLLPKKGGGRIAALEILIVTPAISNLIREGKTFQIPSSMQTGKAQGMVMLNDALFSLVQKGMVEPRDAYIKAVDKTGFESLLTRGGFKI